MLAICSSSRWRTMTGSCCCSMAPRRLADSRPEFVGGTGSRLLPATSSVKRIRGPTDSRESNGLQVKYQGGGRPGKRPTDQDLLFLESPVPKNAPDPGEPPLDGLDQSSWRNALISQYSYGRLRSHPAKQANPGGKGPGRRTFGWPFVGRRCLHKRLSCAKTYEERTCLKRNVFSKSFPRRPRRGGNIACRWKVGSWEFKAGPGRAQEATSPGSRTRAKQAGTRSKTKVQPLIR